MRRGFRVFTTSIPGTSTRMNIQIDNTFITIMSEYTTFGDDVEEPNSKPLPIRHAVSGKTQAGTLDRQFC